MMNQYQKNTSSILHQGHKLGEKAGEREKKSIHFDV